MARLTQRVDRLENGADIRDRAGRFAIRNIAIVAAGEPIPPGYDEAIELIGVDPAPRMAELARLRGDL